MLTSRFQKIRRSRGITIHQIADLAGVAPREEFLFEIGARIAQKQAENMVVALNQLTGEHYTLADFRGAVTHQPTAPLPAIRGRGETPIRRTVWKRSH